MSNSNVNYLYEQHSFDVSKVTNLLTQLIKFGNFQCLPAATLIGNMAAFQMIISTGKFMPFNQSFFINFDEFHHFFLEYLYSGSIKNIESFFSPQVLSTVEHTKDYQNLK